MASETLSRPIRAVYLDVLHRLEPICALSPARLAELAALCQIETYVLGESVAGTWGAEQAVYLLAGELVLRLGDSSTAVLVGGTEAARWPITRLYPDVLSAKAITDAELVRIDDDMLDILMTWDQLSAIASTPPSSGGTDRFLLSGAFRVQSLTAGALSRLPAASIDELFRRFERVRVKAGQIIVSEGEAGDFYYVIESGRCAVTRQVGGVEMPLAELKTGDAFGEEALVAECTRNATIRMKSAGVLLRLDKNDFVELLREPLLKRVSRTTAEKLVHEGALWLDVRYPAEYRRDRLPDAINVPLGEIRHALGVLDNARSYVVYCDSGRRSSAAAFLLSQHGYRASCLKGGLRGESPTTPPGPPD